MPSPATLSPLLLIGLIAPPVLAQSEATTSQLDDIVVTGTRATGRTETQSLSPIDVLRPDDLAATGSTELATALSRLLPSLNFPRPSLTDGTDSVRPAQLRGLSPDQVLVLVNGKRRHTAAILNVNGTQGRGSSPVDLNAIPIAAIARIEVLRDGAAAQYGSDAIAGVVNVVLKGSPGDGSVSLQGGQYSAGDGRQVDLGGDAGFALGERGWLHLSGQYVEADPTNRAGVDFRFPGDVSYGRKNHRFGDADTRNTKLFANAQVDLSDAVQFYAFANASKRDAEAAGNYRQAGNANNIASIYPEGFLPLIATESEDRSLVAGLRGTSAGGWRWDVSANYGANTLDFGVRNSLNASLGPTSPTSFDAGELENEQLVVNLDIANDLDWGLANPVTLAFGGEYRDETYTIRAGEPASYVAGTGGVAGASPGAQVFPGFQPGDAGSNGRDSYSAYLELDTDFTDKLSGSVAARYEDYSDFGDTASGKLALRYAVSDAFALRGTLSNGFRAPSLAQQYYSATSAVLIGGSIFEVRTFPVELPVARAFGAQPLKAEKSTNASLGFVAQPLDNLSLTVDLYRIDIDDRVVLSENLTGTAVRDFLAAQGYAGVNGGRYFTNAVDTRTTGIDVLAAWRVAVGDGALDLSAGYNYNKTKIRHIQANAPELDALGFQRIGRVEIGRITEGAPRDKITFGSDYTIGNWGLRAGLTRYGENTVRQTNPANDQTFGAKWILDLAASYRHDDWTFTLGADNALNEYPDEVRNVNWGNPATAPSGLFRYSSYSPFGFNGAFVYGKVAYTW